MPKLGVNIDHIATLREQRKPSKVDILEALKIVESAGADGVTIHLREDRRHIQDKDVFLIKKYKKKRLNLEMSLNKEIVDIALRTKPDSVCIVPERRKELTTEGGLDVYSQKKRIKKVIKRLKQKKIFVSLFIAPEKKQVLSAKEVGADAVEIHTGKYADAKSVFQRRKELQRIKRISKLVLSLGLELHAGHGLDYNNVKEIAKIKGMEELNIGYSIVTESIFIGLEKAVKRMKNLLEE